MTIFLLLCVLSTQAVMAGVLYVVIMEQRRNTEAVARIHTAVASFEQRRMVVAMQHDLERYFNQPMEMCPTPVDILPRIIHKAVVRYEEQQKRAA